MSDIWATRILHDATTGLGRAKRIRRFLVVSTWLMIALGGLWALYALSIGNYALLIGDLVLITLGASSFLLLRARLITMAIHLLLLGLLVWILTMAYFVSGSGVDHNGAVHYWLIVYIVALHFVLFDAGRIIQTFYVSASIFIFVIIEYALVPLDPAYGFPIHDRLFSHGLTLGLVLIAIALITRTYISDLADAERRIRDANLRSEAAASQCDAALDRKSHS